MLFDSVEVMNTVLRTIVATTIHLATHTEVIQGVDSIKRSLPPDPEYADSGNDTVLAFGMSAGLYVTIWEVGEMADYPSDVLASKIAKSVQAPEDVIKAK